MEPGLSTDLLQRAARLRALALLLLPPNAEGAGELARLCEGVPDGAGDALRSLASEYGPAHEGVYHALLGASGALRDAESDYEVNALGGKGPLLADVAGFYQAFRYDHESLGPISMDHVSAELDYLAWLAFREAYARYEGNAEGAAVCHDAAEAFGKAHLGVWARSFAKRIRDTAPESYYARVATTFEEQLGELLGASLVGVLPSLRRGPGLPVWNDSEGDEGDPFALECDGPVGPPS